MKRRSNLSSRRTRTLHRSHRQTCPIAASSCTILEKLESRTLLAGGAVGGEFRVNSYTPGDQCDPSIAMDSAGNFVAVWESMGQDGSDNGIFAQRYNALGVPQGAEFRVNTWINYVQSDPKVAMDSAGNFVVTWQSHGQDGYHWGICAQRYNAAGVPQGGEFIVNSYTDNEQTTPAIAMSGSGDFVIVWQSGGQDGSGYGIFGQRYSAAGARLGGEFMVNTYTAHDQTYPCVAMNSSGDFVVAWQSFSQDGSDWGIFAQRYAASGARQGMEFQVNSVTNSIQCYPSIAIDSAGNFVAVWQSYGGDGSDYGVTGRRYDAATGSLSATETPINSYTISVQSNPSIAMDSAGNSVVTWQSQGSDGWGVYAQRFSPALVRQGGESLVNTHTDNDQTSPAVAMKSNGSSVIAWQSGAQDGSGQGVYAQRYDAAPPTARKGSAPNLTTAVGTSYQFTVIYSDPNGVNAATIGNGDIEIVAPNGFLRDAQFVSCTPTGNGATLTATYQIAAPGGQWDASDAGTYTIRLRATQVADLGENYAAAATLATFNADFAAPTAKLEKLAKVKRGKSPFRFTVTYSDDAAINIASIGNGDILITGPKRFKQYATFRSAVASGTGKRTAIYEIAAPGKKWDAADNGIYTIWLNAKHVRDATGKAASKAKLGALKVRL